MPAEFAGRYTRGDLQRPILLPAGEVYAPMWAPDAPKEASPRSLLDAVGDALGGLAKSVVMCGAACVGTPGGRPQRTRGMFDGLVETDAPRVNVTPAQYIVHSMPALKHVKASEKRVRTTPLTLEDAQVQVPPPPAAMDALNAAAWEARQEDLRRMLDGFRKERQAGGPGALRFLLQEHDVATDGPLPRPRPRPPRNRSGDPRWAMRTAAAPGQPEVRPDPKWHVQTETGGADGSGGGSSSAIDWKDSNVAGIGSAEDRALRKQAAETEPAWWGCGAEPGLEIWRIEQFKVVPWPRSEYGNFYNGDSYIILHTREGDNEVEGEEGSSLSYKIFFWLGLYTSIDEQGTAAYKTVELDDLLDSAASQHREVMEYESEAFLALFPRLKYLEGGVESGFRSVCDVDLEAHVARLLHIKKNRTSTVCAEVPCKRESLNHGDAFILDTGSVIYTWNGAQSSAFERAFTRLAAEELERARIGKAISTNVIDETFWEILGGEGPIKSAKEAGEELPQTSALGDGVLYKLSDETGKLSFDEVNRGSLDLSMLVQDDVYLCDPGTEIIVWVGVGASDRERRAAMLTATKYLALQGKPHTTPIKVFKSTDDAMQDSSFAQIFAGC